MKFLTKKEESYILLNALLKYASQKIIIVFANLAYMTNFRKTHSTYPTYISKKNHYLLAKDLWDISGT